MELNQYNKRNDYSFHPRRENRIDDRKRVIDDICANILESFSSGNFKENPGVREGVFYAAYISKTRSPDFLKDESSKIRMQGLDLDEAIILYNDIIKSPVLCEAVGLEYSSDINNRNDYGKTTQDSLKFFENFSEAYRSAIISVNEYLTKIELFRTPSVVTKQKSVTIYDIWPDLKKN